MILDDVVGRRLNAQVTAVADSQLRRLLKTASSAPTARLGLGATRMNNLFILRTHANNRTRRARGHELM